jgi:hypothetical protein
MERVSSQKLFSAILRERIDLDSLEYPGVRLRKIGVLPNGLTIGNSAVRTTKQLSKTSKTGDAGMKTSISAKIATADADGILKALPLPQSPWIFLQV